MIVTLVLAAGRGTRIGGPKALLDWPLDGRRVPLATAHVACSGGRVVVVTRDDIAAVLRNHEPVPEIVISAAPDAQGPAGSIAAAMVALDAAEIVLITPVDCPPVAPATTRALVDALRADQHAQAAKPRYRGKGGHPVALRMAGLVRYRQPDPPPLRDVMATLPLVEVVVDDAGVTRDIDDAAALGRAVRFFTE